MINNLYYNAIKLLTSLIATPSHSREEEQTATIIASFLTDNGVENVERMGNNVWAYNLFFDESKPTILLNSHHDTVKPNSGYSRNPYEPTVEDGKLFGLGSNDAGGSLVSLISTFLFYYKQSELKYNLCIALTAEEEVSGKGGIEMIIPHLKNIEFAIVGEPTLMDLAVAERGLIVVDCTSHGESGHAARNEGENAIYKALDDINWFRNYQFEKVSETFGAMKMNVTMVNSGSQHNVIPSECSFVVDIRVIDQYSNEEVIEIIEKNVSCTVKPRSLRLRPSSISLKHPLVKKGIEMGRKCYGSPTMSDQALLSVPSLKMGVGDSARSHVADEFIFLHEIKEGIEGYIELLKAVL